MIREDMDGARIAEPFEQQPESHRLQWKVSGMAVVLGEWSREEGLDPSVPVVGAWACLLGRYGDADHIRFSIGSLGVIQVDLDPLPVNRFLARVAQAMKEPEPFSDDVETHLIPNASKEIAPRDSVALTLELLPAQDLLCLYYDANRFDSSQASRLGTHLTILLRTILSDRNHNIQQLPMLSKAECEQILEAWNRTTTPYNHSGTVQHMVESQASRVPHHRALVLHAPQELLEQPWWTTSLSAQYPSIDYDTLNEKANQLAWYLMARGVGPDVVVGVCMERSVELIIGLLAVLKAGGAYLPLDPVNPRERLAHMLDDAAPSLLLTQKHLHRQFGESKTTLLVIEDEWQQVEKESISNPSVDVDEDNLSYVVFTSGSTGRPKGVLVRHGSFYNSILWTIRCFGLGAGQNLLHFLSLGFDAASSHLFRSLSSGATLHFLLGDVREMGARLPGVLEECHIHHAAFPSSVLSALPPDRLPKLKTVIVGAEAFSAGLVKKWSAGRRFYNVYGPTETTFCATLERCPPDGSKPTIGRPIDNTRIYLLDHHLMPVPQGIQGELHIAGDGLARCYLNRPGLTAVRFIPNPFGEPGERLFKSGDLGRFLPDGRIDFLGRLDNQVKIRGYRIELGEIQAVLTRHEDVRDCVVVMREDGPHKALAAYFTREKDGGDDHQLERAVRSWLDDHLPHYMVPRFLVILPQLPLTIHGKVNLGSLPAPPSDTRLGRKPESHEERVLADVFAELLGLEEVTTATNFFDAGGSSVLMIRLIEMAEKHHIHLTPAQVLHAPSLGQMASLISG